MNNDKRLICSLIEQDGKIQYLVIDVNTAKLEKLTYEQAMGQILSHTITNAKMENTVIKTVDSNYNQSQLRFNYSDSNEVYYVFDRYTSKFGKLMYSIVSNKGEIYELSENIALKFLNKSNLINGVIKEHKINIIKSRGFTSALSRSYNNAPNTHH